ncbi:adhesin [Dactylosporangium sp. NPDC048998]|uniref:adhesin n=1 Tax=Dactylosporangium sp. NPDC048998 TaxID=3363976 RepID=UPI00370FF323
MVLLTDNAVIAIQSLTTQPGAPEGGGLRIAADETRASLTLSLASSPAQGDAVVEASGARLFLDPTATEVLNDKTLDAGADNEGQIEFTVT